MPSPLAVAITGARELRAHDALQFLLAHEPEAVLGHLAFGPGDRVLVAVGRVPNCANLGLENTKSQTDEKGFIKTNPQRRTDDEAIYAVGDIAGGTLLAHKASREARIAVEALCGELSGTE